MLILQVLLNYLHYIWMGNLLNIGRTPCQIIEDIAHLQVM